MANLCSAFVLLNFNFTCDLFTDTCHQNTDCLTMSNGGGFETYLKASIPNLGQVNTTYD